MNVHPQTAAYRALNFVFKDAFRINALSNAAQCGEAQFLFSATLAQTFNNLSSALTGAAMTTPALAEPFIAAGAAVAFIRCNLLFLKGPHGLVVPSRLGSFLLQKKVRPPWL
jgi:hypothetical protein